jgi:hypothetical protein
LRHCEAHQQTTAGGAFENSTELKKRRPGDCPPYLKNIMKNHEMVTLLLDDQRLAELEKTIARGKKTFVDVGLALAEIRDLRLYRREFSSFKEYCQKKWGWTKQHAYRLIEAAPIGKSHHVVTDEATARVLAGVSPSERAGLIETVVEAGKPVTAAELKRHLPPPPVEKSHHVVTLSGNAKPPVPPTPPPAKMVDGTGWPIPTQLIPLWQRTGEVQEWLTVLSRLKGVLRAAQDSKDTLYAEMNFSSALSQLDQAWTDLKTAKPFAVCPTCQGQVPENCTLCRGRGLISEHRWNACVTSEDKAFREKAKNRNSEVVSRQSPVGSNKNN